MLPPAARKGVGAGLQLTSVWITQVVPSTPRTRIKRSVECGCVCLTPGCERSVWLFMMCVCLHCRLFTGEHWNCSYCYRQISHFDHRQISSRDHRQISHFDHRQIPSRDHRQIQGNRDVRCPIQDRGQGEWNVDRRRREQRVLVSGVSQNYWCECTNDTHCVRWWWRRYHVVLGTCDHWLGVVIDWVCNIGICI